MESPRNVSKFITMSLTHRFNHDNISRETLEFTRVKLSRENRSRVCCNFYSVYKLDNVHLRVRVRSAIAHTSVNELTIVIAVV